MATEIPVEIFKQPNLTEQPVLRNQRASRETIIRTYNFTFARLARRAEQIQPIDRGQIEEIKAKTDRSEDLTPAEQAIIRDCQIKLDHQIASFGRRNINAADYINHLTNQQRSGQTLTLEQSQFIDSYEAGNFHQIPGTDDMLSHYISTDRFVVPAQDGDMNFAIEDGAPIEGLLRELDREIAETKQKNSSPLEKRQMLRLLRQERDTLFTESTQLFAVDNSITHARKQLEAFFKYQGTLAEWDLPDWLKGEYLVNDRLVLNIPRDNRGRTRFGELKNCLSVLALPLVAACCLAVPIVWTKVNEKQPLQPSVEPKPTETAQHPCSDPTQNVRYEIFSLDKDPNASIFGAIQREIGYRIMAKDQLKYGSPDDETMLAALDDQNREDPNYIPKYTEIAIDDYIKTANLLRGTKVSEPFIQGTDFESKYALLASCLTPEEKHLKTVQALQADRSRLDQAQAH